MILSSCIEPRESAPFRKIEVKRAAQDSWTYAQLDQYQRQILDEVCAGNPGTLLLSEVAPVVTYGRRTPEADLLGSLQLHSNLGITRYAADRGGLATYHGPGQWVLFPVESLQTLTGDRRGVRKAVQLLLDAALEVGLQYDSTAHLREGAELGVWTSRGKFAAVGIHVQKGVLLHGLSLNGFKTPTSFVGLRPCGLDAPVDFLLPDSSETAFMDLGNRLIHAFLQKLNPASRSH